MEQVFLISGKAYHGKDSTAKFLKDKLPEGKTLILHYADYLKLIAKMYLGWSGQKDEEGRNILQWLGTERVRLELKRPLFWVKSVCDAIEITSDKYDYFCVPDCRFPNEVYYPKAAFSGKVTTIKVVRTNFASTLTEEQKRHPSEVALNGFVFDYTIESVGGLDQLGIQVDNFLERYRLDNAIPNTREV